MITDDSNPSRFSDHYKGEVFTIWYNAGKPTYRVLYNMLPPDPKSNAIPAQSTVQTWIAKDFMFRAEDLDKQVMDQVSANLVAEKVEMLRRHADTGKEMHRIATEWLETHVDDLTASTAIRLLVEGIRIERESVGLPEALKKMMSMNDEELLEEVQSLISNAPSSLLPPSSSETSDVDE